MSDDTKALVANLRWVDAALAHEAADAIERLERYDALAAEVARLREALQSLIQARDNLEASLPNAAYEYGEAWQDARAALAAPKGDA